MDRPDVAGGSTVGGDALIHRRPSSAVRRRALPALSTALPDFRQRCPQHEPNAGPAPLSGGSTGGASHKTASLNSPVTGRRLGRSRAIGSLVIRPASADRVPRFGHLRSPCPQSDGRHPEISPEFAGHLRRVGPPSHNRLPASRCDRGRADAGAPVRARSPHPARSLLRNAADSLAVTRLAAVRREGCRRRW
jgi:hypothetical protein